MAIVGRPNVGKSTLVNRLLGEDRVLTDAKAGITRDAVHIPGPIKGRAIGLVDTAGLRRKARVTDKLEALSGGDAVRALRFAEIVVLVLDAEAPLEKQDLTIARTTLEEGRALILAVNKWDLVKDRKAQSGASPTACKLRCRRPAAFPSLPSRRLPGAVWRGSCGGAEGRRGMEQAHTDGAAQPLARRCLRKPPAAACVGAAHPAAAT